MALDNLCSLLSLSPCDLFLCRVRPAVSERHAETLRTAEGNVPPQLTRRSQERSERRSGAAAH